jgi:hypothetical protein
MRIWVGEEKEGAYTGERTLFVESGTLSEEVFSAVAAILPEFKNVKTIYFGAGCVDVWYISPMIDSFFRWASTYSVILEVGVAGLNSSNNCANVYKIMYDFSVVHRIPFKLIIRSNIAFDPKGDFSLKLEVPNKVYVADETIFNYIDEVKNGMYPGDELICDTEED